MGCCQSRNATEGGPDETRKTLDKIEDFRRQKNWNALVKYIDSEDSIETIMMNLSTIGGLALLYMRDEARENPSIIEEICAKYANKFVSNLKRCNEVTNMTMAVLFYALDANNSSFKRTLVETGIFTQLIRFFSSKENYLKMMAFQLARKIYSRDTSLQDEFFKADGHIALVEMIKEKVDDDSSLIDLLQEVRDLLYNENDELNPNHLMKLRSSDLFDILNGIKLDERDEEVQEAVRELRSI